MKERPEVVTSQRANFLMKFSLHSSINRQIVNGQYVEGFYIYSIKVDSNGVYKMLTVLHGGGASSCTISQLERNTLYNFFLIPFYKNIEGKPSNLIQSATLEDGENIIINIQHFIRDHFHDNFFLFYLINFLS